MVITVGGRGLGGGYGPSGNDPSCKPGRYAFREPGIFNMPWNRFRGPQKRKMVYIYNQVKTQQRSAPASRTLYQPLTMDRYLERTLDDIRASDFYALGDMQDKNNDVTWSRKISSYDVGDRKTWSYPRGASRLDYIQAFDNIMNSTDCSQSDTKTSAVSSKVSRTPKSSYLYYPTSAKTPPRDFNENTSSPRMEKEKALARAKKIRKQKDDIGEDVVAMDKECALDRARRLRKTYERKIVKKINVVDEADVELIEEEALTDEAELLLDTMSNAIVRTACSDDKQILAPAYLHEVRMEIGKLEDLMRELREAQTKMDKTMEGEKNRVKLNERMLWQDIYKGNEEMEQLYAQGDTGDQGNITDIKTMKYSCLDQQILRREKLQRIKKQKDKVTGFKYDLHNLYCSDIGTLKGCIMKLKQEEQMILEERDNLIKQRIAKDVEWKKSVEEELAVVKKESIPLDPKEIKRIDSVLSRTAEDVRLEKVSKAEKRERKQKKKLLRKTKSYTEMLRKTNQDFYTHMEIRRETAKPIKPGDSQPPLSKGVFLEQPQSKLSLDCIKKQNKKWGKLQKQYDKKAQSVEKKQRRKAKWQKRIQRLKLLPSRCIDKMTRFIPDGKSLSFDKKLRAIRFYWWGKRDRLQKSMTHVKERSLNSKPSLVLRKSYTRLKNATSRVTKKIGMGMLKLKTKVIGVKRRMKRVKKILKKHAKRAGGGMTRAGKKTDKLLNKCYRQYERAVYPKAHVTKPIFNFSKTAVTTKVQGNNWLARFCNGLCLIIRFNKAKLFNNDSTLNRVVRDVPEHQREPLLIGFERDRFYIQRRMLLFKTLKQDGPKAYDDVADLWPEKMVSGTSRAQLHQPEEYMLGRMSTMAESDKIKEKLSNLTLEDLTSGKSITQIVREYAEESDDTIGTADKENDTGGVCLTLECLGNSFNLVSPITCRPSFRGCLGKLKRNIKRKMTDKFFNGCLAGLKHKIRGKGNIKPKHEKIPKTKIRKQHRHVAVKQGIRAFSSSSSTRQARSPQKAYLSEAKRNHFEKMRRDRARKQQSGLKHDILHDRTGTTGILSRISTLLSSLSSTESSSEKRKDTSEDPNEQIAIIKERIRTALNTRTDPTESIRDLRSYYARIKSTDSLTKKSKVKLDDSSTLSPEHQKQAQKKQISKRSTKDSKSTSKISVKSSVKNIFGLLKRSKRKEKVVDGKKKHHKGSKDASSSSDIESDIQEKKQRKKILNGVSRATKSSSSSSDIQQKTRAALRKRKTPTDHRRPFRYLMKKPRVVPKQTSNNLVKKRNKRGGKKKKFRFFVKNDRWDGGRSQRRKRFHSHKIDGKDGQSTKDKSKRSFAKTVFGILRSRKSKRDRPKSTKKGTSKKQKETKASRKEKQKQSKTQQKSKKKGTESKSFVKKVAGKLRLSKHKKPDSKTTVKKPRHDKGKQRTFPRQSKKADTQQGSDTAKEKTSKVSFVKKMIGSFSSSKVAKSTKGSKVRKKFRNDKQNKPTAQGRKSHRATDKTKKRKLGYFVNRSRWRNPIGFKPKTSKSTSLDMGTTRRQSRRQMRTFEKREPMYEQSVVQSRITLFRPRKHRKRGSELSTESDAERPVRRRSQTLSMHRKNRRPISRRFVSKSLRNAREQRVDQNSSSDYEDIVSSRENIKDDLKQPPKSHKSLKELFRSGKDKAGKLQNKDDEKRQSKDKIKTVTDSQSRKVKGSKKLPKKSASKKGQDNSAGYEGTTGSNLSSEDKLKDPSTKNKSKTSFLELFKLKRKHKDAKEGSGEPKVKGKMSKTKQFSERLKMKTNNDERFSSSSSTSQSNRENTEGNTERKAEPKLTNEDMSRKMEIYLAELRERRAEKEAERAQRFTSSLKDDTGDDEKLSSPSSTSQNHGEKKEGKTRRRKDKSKMSDEDKAERKRLRKLRLEHLKSQFGFKKKKTKLDKIERTTNSKKSGIMGFRRHRRDESKDSAHSDGKPSLSSSVTSKANEDNKEGGKKPEKKKRRKHFLKLRRFGRKKKSAKPGKPIHKDKPKQPETMQIRSHHSGSKNDTRSDELSSSSSHTSEVDVENTDGKVDHNINLRKSGEELPERKMSKKQLIKTFLFGRKNKGEKDGITKPQSKPKSGKSKNMRFRRRRQSKSKDSTNVAVKSSSSSTSQTDGDNEAGNTLTKSKFNRFKSMGIKRRRKSRSNTDTSSEDRLPSSSSTSQAGGENKESSETRKRNDVLRIFRSRQELKDKLKSVSGSASDEGQDSETPVQITRVAKRRHAVREMVRAILGKEPSSSSSKSPDSHHSSSSSVAGDRASDSISSPENHRDLDVNLPGKRVDIDTSGRIFDVDTSEQIVDINASEENVESSSSWTTSSSPENKSRSQMDDMDKQKSHDEGKSRAKRERLRDKAAKFFGRFRKASVAIADKNDSNDEQSDKQT